MKIKFLIIISLLFCTSAFAGGPKKLPLKQLESAARAAEKQLIISAGSLGRTSIPGAKNAAQAMQGAARRAATTPGWREGLSAQVSQALESRSSGRKLAERTMIKSLVQVVGAQSGEVLSSGFVIEESLFGEKQLWAVLPYHVVGSAKPGDTGKLIHLKVISPQGSSIIFQVRAAASGGYGVNSADVALAKLPAIASRYVKPLLLAKAEPAAGSEAYVYGFPNASQVTARFTALPAASVLDASGYKVRMNYPTNLNLSGSCGSPILNEEGEVIGLFSGFVPGEYMFGVNTQTGILDVLNSYYQNKVTRALKVHHVEFARLGVEESIRTISVYRNGARIRKIDLYSYYEPFDYAYLERLVPLVSGDALLVQTVEHRADKRILRYIMP